MHKVTAISDFVNYAQNSKYVSFDLFDTLIKRKYLGVHQIHDAVSAYAMVQIGRHNERKPHEITRLRYAMGTALKAATHTAIQEPTTEMVWDRVLAHEVPDAEKRAGLVARIVDFEHRMELANLATVEGVHELLASLKADGKTVIAVSDMYFSLKQMQTILRKLGILDYFDHVYVSADANLTKQTGDLFRKVVADLGIAPEDLLHVGDNQHSDVAMAIEAGVRPVLVEQHHLLQLEQPQYGSRERIEQEIADVVKAHLLSVLIDVHNRQADHIYFMARDGCTIRAFLENWQPEMVRDFLPPPGFSDMYLNRVLTGWANVDFSGNWMVEAIGIAFWLKEGKATAAELSELLGIESVPAELGTEVLHSWNDTPRVERAYRDAHLEEELRAALLAKRAQVERYLRDAGFFDKRAVAISDIGYSGSVLTALNKLFLQRAAEESDLTPPPVKLHLVATYKNYETNRPAAMPFVEFADHAVLAMENLPEGLSQGFSWLEYFFKHPTLKPILGFTEVDGKLVADLQHGEAGTELMPSERLPLFADGGDADITLLWMSLVKDHTTLFEPILARLADPDPETLAQMREEIYELDPVKGTRRSIILEMPGADPVAVSEAARLGDYWVAGSLAASQGSTGAEPEKARRKPDQRPLGKRVLGWLRSSRKSIGMNLAQLRGFDPEFYRSFYPDLRQFGTDDQLRRHYLRHGRAENRVGSRAALIARLTGECGPIPPDFEPETYIQYNPDIATVCDTPERALDHFMRQGAREGRPYRPFLTRLIDEFEALRATGAIRLGPAELDRLGRGDATLKIFLDRHGLKIGPWINQIEIDEFVAMHSAWCGQPHSRAECIVALCEKGLERTPALSLRTPFDSAFYASNPDVPAGLSPVGLYLHYLNVGSANSRPASEAAALERLLGKRDWPDCFDWEAWRRRARGLASDARRIDVLTHFADDPKADKAKFVRGEGSVHFLIVLGKRAWQQHRRREEARRLLEEASRRGGATGEAEHLLGDLACEEGRSGQAIHHYRRSIAATNPSRWSYVNAAELLLEQGDYKSALQCLDAGTVVWQGSEPWRGLRARALTAWAQACTRHVAGCLDTTPNLSEADAIVAMADGDLPARHEFAARGQGLFVVTSRPVSARRGDLWLAGDVTVCGVEALSETDFLGAMLRHGQVVFHEVPFSYEAARAIGTARMLGRSVVGWLGDLTEWDGYDLKTLCWGERAEERSLLTEASAVGMALTARYCDRVVTTLAGLTALLRKVAPALPLEEHVSSQPDLRGERAEKRVVLIAPVVDASARQLAFLAESIRKAASADQRLHFFLDERLGRRRELLDVAGRWSPIEADTALPTLARMIALIEVVVQPADHPGMPFEMWAEALARGVPAVVAPLPRETQSRDALPHWPESMPLAGPRLDEDILHLAATADRAAATHPTADVVRQERGRAFTNAPVGRRKRILFVNLWFAPQVIGGATRVLKDNVDYLLDHHADEFEIAVFASDEHNPNCGQFTVDGYRDVPVFRVATPQEANIYWRPDSAMVAARFEAVLESFQPDIVHFHCLQRLTVTVAETCSRHGIPYFVTMHDAWWLSDYQFFNDENGLYAPARQDFLAQPRLDLHGATASAIRAERLREALLGAARRLAVSHRFKAVYEQCGIPCDVVENGASRLKPEPRPVRSGRVQLCHTGGMERHKGLYLVEAALRAGSFRNLEMTAIDLARETGDVSHTIWGATPVNVIGKLPADQMGALYARMDVLLAPSTCEESYGLVTREAFAHGLWVVSGDRGAISEPVVPGVNGFVVSVDNAEGIATALTRIDADPAAFMVSPPVDGSNRTADDQARELIALYRSA